MSRMAFTNATLFTSQQQLDNQTVIIKDGIIEAVLAENYQPEGIKVIDCQGHILAPGFIDIQVNGGGGVMFNEQPTLTGINKIRRAHWSGGTTAMLPTLITDTSATMQKAIDAVEQALVSLPGILGIHLEGPHLSLMRRGVHSAQQIRPFGAVTESMLKQLGADKYLITIAPETVPQGTIRKLNQLGIRVSAGHTEATYAQIRAALDEGLSCFTHLYNAMTPITGREPGVVGAALEDAASYCGIIIDGHHLHYTTAKLAIANKTRGKMLLVTDAMATVGSTDNSFNLYGEVIHDINGRCAKPDGTLAGSALDMITAVRNCVTELNLPLSEALRMASLYPAQFLGVDTEYGYIKPGYRADLVLLDKALILQQTWVQGELCFELSKHTASKKPVKARSSLQKAPQNLHESAGALSPDILQD